MTAFTTALAPIMVLILMGYTLKRARFLTDDVWQGIEKLTYYILFPALLIRTLGNQSIAGTSWPSMLLVTTLILIVASFILILFRRTGIVENNAAFTSIFQGGVRFNTYIILAIAQSLFGSEGLATGSVVVGFMVILVNFLSVSIFVIWGNAQFDGTLAFVKAVAANPLIIGSSIGWFLSLSGIGLPGVTDDIFEIMGRAALPFGLLAVGAALKLQSIRGHLTPIVLSSIIQFGFKPLAAAIMVTLTGITGVTAGVIIIAFMVPTAPSAYILARQLGGDTEAMASIITFQTLLAFLVMPLIAFMLL